MSARTAFEFTSGTVGNAEAPLQECILQSGTPLAIFIEMLRVGKLFPVVLKRDQRRSDDSGSYPVRSYCTGDLDTLVTAEETGYTGDGATKAFTGQSLNNVPVVPFTVEVSYLDNEDDTITLYDKYGDGDLYQQGATYTSEAAVGTINYLTGAVVLALATGSVPKNLEKIYARYLYTVQVGSADMAGVKKVYTFRAISTTPELEIRFVADRSGAVGKVDLVIDQQA